jgi:hypothetical protein
MNAYHQSMGIGIVAKIPIVMKPSANEVYVSASRQHAVVDPAAKRQRRDGSKRGHNQTDAR